MEGNEIESKNQKKPFSRLMPMVGVYLFIYAAAYSIHDFINKDMREFTKSDNKVLLLHLLSIVKFFIGSPVGSYADKNKNHNKILIGALLSFSFILFFKLIFQFYLERFEPAIRLSILCIAMIIYYISLGIVFPLLESLSINYIKNINRMNNYYILKVSGSIGHLLAYIPGLVIGSEEGCWIKTQYQSKHLKYIFGGLYALIAIFILFFSRITYKIMDLKNDKKKNEAEENSKVSILKKIFRLLRSDYLFFILPVILQGYNRATTQTFLRNYQEKVGFSLKDGNKASILRLFIEIFVYLSLGKFKRPEYIYYFFCFCGLVVNIRPFLIYLVVPDDSFDMKRIKFRIAESSKALFSSFFGYSSVRIAEQLSPPGYETLAQSICLGVYNGLSSIPFVTISFFIFNFVYTDESSTVDEETIYFKRLRLLFLIATILGLFGWLISVYLVAKRGCIKNNR